MAGTFSVDKGASDVVTRKRFVVPTDSFSLLPLLFNLLSSIEPAMYWGRNMLPYLVENSLVMRFALTVVVVSSFPLKLQLVLHMETSGVALSSF